MSLQLSSIKNKSQETLDLDDLRQLPLAIRDYYAAKKVKFDKRYDNRTADTFLQRFKSTKYPIRDRIYGSPNEDIANIFLNLLQDKTIQNVLDNYLFEKKWVYHPVRKFDRWNTISNFYYDTEDYYWLILLFNKITDPFQAMLHFNMVRIPYSTIIQEMPYREEYSFTGVIFR